MSLARSNDAEEDREREKERGGDERERLGQVRRRARNPCNAGTYAIQTAFRMHREMSREIASRGRSAEEGGNAASPRERKKWVLLGS